MATKLKTPWEIRVWNLIFDNHCRGCLGLGKCEQDMNFQFQQMKKIIRKEIETQRLRDEKEMEEIIQDRFKDPFPRP